MTNINQLSSTDSLSGSDLVPLFSQANGNARKSSLTQIAQFIQGLITSTDDKLTQYYAPSVSGFQVQINNDNLSVFLILTPTAGFVAGTLILPLEMNCQDKQELLIVSTQLITTLTINANGSSIVGAPSTLAANGYFKLRFDGVTSTWYRIG